MASVASNAMQEALEKAAEELRRRRDFNRRGGVMSYAEYVAQAGAPFEKSKQTVIEQAKMAEGLASPTYGRAGEALGRGGLAGGGYTAAVRSTLAQQTEQVAAKADAEAEAKLSADYQTYVKQEKARRVSLERSCLSQMIRGKLTDYEKALTFALDFGLTDGEADRAARMAVAVGEANAKEQAKTDRIAVVNKIVSYGLPPEYGTLLAMLYGFEREEAGHLAALAQTIHYNTSRDNRSYGYSDYLTSIEGVESYLETIDLAGWLEENFGQEDEQ